MNQLQAVALNEGLLCRKRLWRERGRQQLEAFRLAPGPGGVGTHPGCHAGGGTVGFAIPEEELQQFLDAQPSWLRKILLLEFLSAEDCRESAGGPGCARRSLRPASRFAEKFTPGTDETSSRGRACQEVHCSLAFSTLACFRMGMSFVTAEDGHGVCKSRA